MSFSQFSASKSSYLLAVLVSSAERQERQSADDEENYEVDEKNDGMTEDEYNMDELIMKRMMTLRALSYEC